MNGNLAYQEEFREELIGGKVVAMAPAATNHNRIVRRITSMFEVYLEGRSCEPFGDGEAVYLTEEDYYFPDFMVVCDPDKVRSDGVYGAPDLVAEVLSPSTAWYDRGRKKEIYERCGVREYWLVSPGDKSIEVYLSRDGSFALDNIYTLRPDWELARMKEKERAELVTSFKCSLFDDLDIPLEKIFSRIV